MRLSRRQGLLWSLGIVMLLGLGIGELALRARYRQQVLPVARKKPAEVTIVALGDSIAAGWPGSPDQAWPALLEAHLQAAYPGVTWQIVNAGVKGNTAPMGYARFDRDVAAQAPDAVLIAFGLNDCNRARFGLDRWLEASVPTGPERSDLWRSVQAQVERLGRHFGWLKAPTREPTPLPFPRTTLKGFSATLSALIDRTRDIGSQPVLLTTTPVSDRTAPEMGTIAEAYPACNERARTLAAQRRVPLVELAERAPADALTADGVHLSAAGQRWAADRIFTSLKAAGLWDALARKAQ